MMIRHIGLFTKSEDDLKKLSDRIVAFNLKQGRVTVELEATWSDKEVEGCSDPHYDLVLTYPDKEVALAFWGNKTL